MVGVERLASKKGEKQLKINFIFSTFRPVKGWTHRDTQTHGKKQKTVIRMKESEKIAEHTVKEDVKLDIKRGRWRRVFGVPTP